MKHFFYILQYKPKCVTEKLCSSCLLFELLQLNYNNNLVRPEDKSVCYNLSGCCSCCGHQVALMCILYNCKLFQVYSCLLFTSAILSLPNVRGTREDTCLRPTQRLGCKGEKNFRGLVATDQGLGFQPAGAGEFNQENLELSEIFVLCLDANLRRVEWILFVRTLICELLPLDSTN